MKKLISLALCLMMLMGLMAINTNAAIPTYYSKVIDVFVRNFDGGADESSSSQFKLGAPAGGNSVGAIEVEGNMVAQFKLDGTAYDTDLRSALVAIHENGFASTVSPAGTTYSITFDLYPVNNTSGISFMYSNISSVHFHPGSFIEGMWNTVKIEVESGTKHYYVKLADADDSTYVMLEPGVDYSTFGGLGSTTFFMGIDTRYMNKNENIVDLENLFKAEYYVDNFVVTKYYPNHRNIVYSNTKDTITSVGGKETNLTGTGLAHSSLNNWFSATFDAVRTGGDQPISFVIAAKGVAKTASFHIANVGERNVKYTYKFNVNQGVSGWQMPPYSAWRKAEGETTWTELTAGVDFFNTSVSNGNADFFRVVYYSGNVDRYGGSPVVDANTVWAINNIQITNTDTAMSGVFEKTETGVEGKFAITKNGGSYAAIVAFYEGEVFKGAAAADISVEGVIDVDFATDAENLTAKVFIWDSLGTLVPVQGIYNVGDFIK